MIAGRQHGNVTHAQLIGCGLTNNAIRHRVQTGRLYRVYPSVYSVGKPPVSPLERASAAVLAAGETAALSHRSAMTLWGYFRHWDSPFEVTVTRDRRPAGVTVHRSTTLSRHEVTRQHGIPVTTPARTLFDIAPRLRPRTLKRAVNDALVSPYLNESALADVLNRHPQTKATRLLAPFTQLHGGPTRSELEDRFLAFCERFGLPRPETNVHVAGYLADAYFPAHGLIVELDGYDYHHGRTAFESDRDRDADTLLAGLPTVRITDTRIERSPAREAERLARILEQRDRQNAATSPPK